MKKKKREYLVTLTKKMKWKVGKYALWSLEKDYLFRVTVNSADRVKALDAARFRYYKARKSDPSLPYISAKPNTLIDRSMRFVSPPQHLLTSLVRARELSLRYYVGGACKHHPDNNIRYTSNRKCVICGSQKASEVRKLGELNECL